jgi:hypothetical protein
MNQAKLSLLKNSKTLIVKVGSSLVTNNGEGWIERYCRLGGANFRIG